MKITQRFTDPQANLGEYDFLLSDEYNLSCPTSSKLYIGSEWRI